jgi:hypothetical protein
MIAEVACGAADAELGALDGIAPACPTLYLPQLNPVNIVDLPQ